MRFRALFTPLIVACAAAPVAPKPVPSVDASAAIEEASVSDVVIADASAATSSMNCDPPRVRDSVTLECTDHAPCPAGRDLASGTCMESCTGMYPTRRPDGGCTCAPGLVDVRGAEFGGCVKPDELDFSKTCKAPHQHFDGSIAPTCKCDAGYVEQRGGGLGVVVTGCVKPCKSPLAYDPVTDRCRTCASDQDAVRGVCVSKCPSSSRRGLSGECECSGGMFLDLTVDACTARPVASSTQRRATATARRARKTGATSKTASRRARPVSTASTIAASRTAAEANRTTKTPARA